MTCFIKLILTFSSRCKNCLIPKPKKNSLVRSKSEFLSESLENLKKSQKDYDDNVSDDGNTAVQSKMPFKMLKFFDYENIDDDQSVDENYSNLIFKSQSNPLPTKPRRWSQSLNSPLPNSNSIQSQKIDWVERVSFFCINSSKLLNFFFIELLCLSS